MEKIDPRLEDVVERLFRSCFETKDYRPAIGIAIEARRLDVVEEGIRLAGERSKKAGKGKQTNDGAEKDQGVELMEYVLEIAMSVVQEITLRNKVCPQARRSRLLCSLLPHSFCDSWWIYSLHSHHRIIFPSPNV